MSHAKSNPLSTRFVEPGRIQWDFTDERSSIEALANYFTCKLNWRAAIVGPHGSGKSTLLEHLVPRLGELSVKLAAYEPPDKREKTLAATSLPDVGTYGLIPSVRSIIWLKLRGAQPSARLLRETKALWKVKHRLLVIDGYEQLRPASRLRLVCETRWRRVGLLVTSHRATWLPTLVRTRVDAAMARRLLDQLLPSDTHNRDSFLDIERLHQLLVHHNGNMREVMMQLYDEVEA